MRSLDGEDYDSVADGTGGSRGGVLRMKNIIHLSAAGTSISMYKINKSQIRCLLYLSLSINRNRQYMYQRAVLSPNLLLSIKSPQRALSVKNKQPAANFLCKKSPCDLPGHRQSVPRRCMDSPPPIGWLFPISRLTPPHQPRCVSPPLLHQAIHEHKIMASGGSRMDPARAAPTH